MKSTGEVMGVGDTFGEAFAKAQMGASEVLPTGGTAFSSACVMTTNHWLQAWPVT